MGVNIEDNKLVITTEAKSIHFHLPKNYQQLKALNWFYHKTQ